MRQIFLTISCGIALLIAGVAPARADEAADLAAFDAATAAGNRAEAAKIYGRLYEARLPKDGKPFADATLDGLAGRLYLLTGEPEYALAWLRKPDAGDRSNRAERLIATAETELLTGNYGEAATVAARAVQQLTGDAQTRALILQAHALVMTNPAAARALVAGRLSPSPSLGWRLAFLDALTAQLTGNVAAARTAADRAQLLANNAPPSDFAPRQMLALQAALAAAQGQRERALTMLGSLFQPSTEANQNAVLISNWLPLCGVDGLRPDDELTISLTSMTVAAVAVPIPVAANRQEIVAPFMRALAGFAIKSDREPAFGPESVLTLRCAVSRQLSASASRNLAFITQAFANGHIRPRFFGWERFAENDPLTAVSRGVDELEARVGPNSPLMILPLAELRKFAAEAYQENQSPVIFARAVSISNRQDALMAALGLEQRVATPVNPDTAVDQQVKLIRNMVESKHVDLAYIVAKDILFYDRFAARDRLAIADLLLARMAPAPGDARYEALLFTRLALLRAVAGGDDVESFARSKTLDPALCVTKTELPTITESGVSDQDFPRDAIVAQISGISILAIDVDAAGTVTRARPLVETPALAFRPTREAATMRMKFAPARGATGKAVPCTDFRQRIRWTLP